MQLTLTMPAMAHRSSRQPEAAMHDGSITWALWPASKTVPGKQQCTVHWHRRGSSYRQSCRYTADKVALQFIRATLPRTGDLKPDNILLRNTAHGLVAKVRGASAVWRLWSRRAAACLCATYMQEWQQERPACVLSRSTHYVRVLFETVLRCAKYPLCYCMPLSALSTSVLSCCTHRLLPGSSHTTVHIWPPFMLHPVFTGC
jgi:hypothetical protein